jgi:predicted NBD/HSP70 family sugar kinase
MNETLAQDAPIRVEAPLRAEPTMRAEPQSRGTNQTGVRAYNERLVLSIIRRHRQIAKAEIARLTGLSAQTVSVIVKALEAEGLLRREAKQRGRVGQPSVPFALDPAGAYGIGFKVGRRSAEVVLIGLTGEVLASRRQGYRYPRPDALAHFARTSIAEVLDGLAPAARRRVAGIGVAVPYEIWSWAEETGAPPDELDRWRDADLVTPLRDSFGMPVFSCNDITAACGAELVLGEAGRFQDFLYLYVGTFVGGGVVLGGSLFPGRTGNAGAMGSLLVPDGRGGAVQLIRRASIYLLEARLEAAGAEPEGLWQSTEAWSGPRPIIDAWLEATGEALALAAVSACSVIDFEAVVIDGALPPTERARLVAAAARALARLERQGLTPFALVAGTLGTFARAMGGACLPLLASFAADRDVLFKDTAT